MRTFARAALLVALLVTPFAAFAEEAAPAKPAAMPCTGPGDKGCCGGACMDAQAKAADGQAQPAGEADCPCKKAAKAAAAAKAAEDAKQGAQ